MFTPGQVLFILFINNKRNPKFLFKFAKLNIQSKNIRNYWSTEILDCTYTYKVNIEKFTNLKKLKCSKKTKDIQVKKLKHLNYLKCGYNIKLSTIQSLRLHTLVISDKIGYYGTITKQLKPLRLHTLKLYYNTVISDQAIKHLQLRTLYDMTGLITDTGVSHMQHIHLLDAMCNKITDNGLKKMQLHVLNPPYNITNDGIRHMQLHIFNNIYDYRINELAKVIYTNTSITDEGIQHMNLHTLSIKNPIMTGSAIKNMFLHTLCVNFNMISDYDIRHMQLSLLYLYRKNCITAEGIKHMNCKVIR